MDRAQLLAEMAGANVRSDDLVFVERRGDDYRWRRLEPGAVPDLAPGQPGSGPDAWIFYSGPWPAGRPGDVPAFVADLLAEMESMCGTADRCRWPLDQPYPLRH